MFSKRANVLVQWLRDRAEEADARGFVFGLSGGIDSAVVARLCQMATPSRVLGVMLPCYSHAQDEGDACLLADAFGIPTARVDLADTFDALTSQLHAAVKGLPRTVHVTDIKQQLPEANIKPRLRMTSLCFIANSLNYLVAGTGNRSELTLGYYTSIRRRRLRRVAHRGSSQKRRALAGERAEHSQTHHREGTVSRFVDRPDR